MKRTLALVTCFVFLGTGTVFAEIEKIHTFELKPEFSYIVYKEPEMKERGVMYGLVGSYTYHNKAMVKLEGRGSVGWVDYSSPISGEINNIRDYMLEIRGLVGYDVFTSESFMITPFVGIGYRYLNDDSSGKTSTIGKSGYERESNYLYSPIGIGWIANLGKNWFIGGTGEYDYFWWGRQRSHLSDVYPGLSDLSNRQRHGYGLRGSIPLQKKGKTVALEFGPFIRYWSIKESETNAITYYGIPILYGYEPKNHSTEVGLMLGIKF
jgi:hypothetical protein